MDKISFKHHRFQPDIIRHAVWLYARFTLSFRDVEDLLAERGLDISYETVRRWFLKFGGPIARNLRHMRPTLHEHPLRRIQHLQRPASFTQQTRVQTVSDRRFQCMGNCERGSLKGHRCGSLERLRLT